MKEFRDKVAVITGAASGIGRGLAERCAQEGMKVVLADEGGDPLRSTISHLNATTLHSVTCLTTEGATLFFWGKS